MLSTTMSLENIVRVIPESTRIFRIHQLDFCCAGEQTLAEACKTKGINPQEVLQEISRLEISETVSAAQKLPLDQLTHYIIKRYHEDLRVRIPELILLATKVEAVHRDVKECPKGLSAHLIKLMEEMEAHMQKEENILFPLINSGRGFLAVMPVQVMKAEHEEHGKNLQKMRDLSHQFIPPVNACTTWCALYAGLDQLEAEIMEHIHLENHVLFVRALQE